jgi:hypothetical protein
MLHKFCLNSIYKTSTGTRVVPTLSHINSYIGFLMQPTAACLARGLQRWQPLALWHGLTIPLHTYIENLFSRKELRNFQFALTPGSLVSTAAHGWVTLRTDSFRQHVTCGHWSGFPATVHTCSFNGERRAGAHPKGWLPGCSPQTLQNRN